MVMMTLLRKELLEQWRTRRLLVLGALFLFFGFLGPITAQLTPELLKLVGTTAPGVVIHLPPPSVNDAVGQYLKNLAQILPLAVLLVAMGSVVGEKERGTLPMVLAKPIPRGSVLGAKFVALVTSVAVSLFLGAVAAFYYTQILFGGLPLGGFLALNLLAGLYLLVVLSLTFLASTVARSTVVAAALAIGLWLAQAILAGLPRVGRASPSALLGWAAQVGVGIQGKGEWLALWVSLAIVAASFGVAWWSFRRQEL